ncbi:hypothetical protein H6G20_19475 [Desertifilum sp. FACHB-1129]|uniref:DUF2808 domain-containing protein n=1 Tax=Desertifilum tharense IPPAS B-1220 TaxID=1781255 RepID=A0A1E5QQM2_9CYAN|nr:MULTISPECIES: hypothetical protein [Desertifilum]MDA0212467.1 hypothetical protein [Cyanobacteria bacterium FC1]MBD2313854.1 hypothetical protein [Desertifilum sp. FACHB-1129]MBD2323239.1 hypothetical protein [Desertifilum sp. FACHB-866]MBD2333084.1 hypothetical protein [Desertifilum sp. FACHB-868]OEJ76921.1 hypothetical protein BH720_01635 [Desertifilum tharense IPPAS B-1220]
MKNIVSSVMTALAVGTSGLLGMSAFAPSAEAQPAQLLRPAQDREITVTQLRNSGSLGLRSHFIDVAVRDYPLNALRITLPPDVYSVNNIEIRDGSGARVEAQTTREGRDLMIAFDQNVVSNDNLRILMDGVRLRLPVLNTGGHVEYQVDAMKEGFTQMLPLGFARVNVQTQSSGSQT